MNIEKFKKEVATLSDDIAKGIAMMLLDKHAVPLSPDAERDVGALVMMNAPAITSLVCPAFKAAGDAEYAYQLGVESGQSELTELRDQLAAHRAVVARALEALKEIAGQALSNEIPMDDIDYVELDYDEAYDDCVMCARSAHAELARLLGEQMEGGK